MRKTARGRDKVSGFLCCAGTANHLPCEPKETMTPRPIARSVALILVTVAAGLVLRMAPLGLPAFAVKYGGSTMWAVMIYWIATTVLASWRPAAVALISGTIATAVEFFKLYQSPGMDAFRATLTGKLLLGRYFSGWDIAAYWAAIAAAALVDGKFLRREG
jgi:hypothetical protein